MGVGEDESLEGSISITIIATGFDVEQQNEIVNTESKKIIHTLEDEQKAEQTLVPKSTGGTVHIPEKPSVAQPKMQDPVIKHTLFDDVEEEINPHFEGYIQTTELLRNLNISYEEVKAEKIEEFNQVEVNKVNVNEFVILEAPKRQEEETKSFPEAKPQEADENMLMFDLPIKSTAAKEPENLKREESTFDLKRIEVRDHVQVVPVTEVSGDGIRRYSLDDYQEMEDHLSAAKPKAKTPEPEEEDIVFETRTISNPNPESDSNDNDPLNTPISKLLRERTEERKRKMKEFNYKFKNSPSRIDEIEKEPAYKRMGIDLSETKNESNISRTSVNMDDDGIELRKNNSFLHDNVD